MAPRKFGSVVQLPSGRWHARYRPRNSGPAVMTFDTEEEAHEFLATVKNLIQTTALTAQEIDAIARQGASIT